MGIVVSMAADPGDRMIEDEAKLARYAADLSDAIDRALPGWVQRCVALVLAAQGLAQTEAVGAAAADAGRRAAEDVGPSVRALLAADLDDQAAGPLALLRSAVSYPTEVLLDAGAAPVLRDDFAVRAFPNDLFALSPAAFADIDEALAEPGLRWGAAKAYVHLARRRSAER